MTSAIAFQNQNNFAPTAKFSFPSALKLRFAETNLSAPAGYSSRQRRKSYYFIFCQKISNYLKKFLMALGIRMQAVFQ